MCGDGTKQRRRLGYKKEDSASPTVSLEGVLLTAAIEAHELRHIACFDIPGAFLHAKCEDGNVFMLLNSFPSMVSYMKPISNLYFAGENHCLLTFARLFYKCKDEYFIY